MPRRALADPRSGREKHFDANGMYAPLWAVLTPDGREKAPRATASACSMSDAAASAPGR